MKVKLTEMLGNDTELSYGLKRNLRELAEQIDNYMASAPKCTEEAYKSIEASVAQDRILEIYNNTPFPNELQAKHFVDLNIKYCMILKAKNLLDKANAL